MEFTFIDTEVEGKAMLAAVIPYLIAIVIILSRFLKIIRNRKLDSKTASKLKRKVYVQATIGMLICAAIHTSLFLVFFECFPDEKNPDATIRTSYYLSILITLLVFTLLLLFGFYLRGTTTLPKHQGPVSGV